MQASPSDVASLRPVKGREASGYENGPDEKRGPASVAPIFSPLELPHHHRKGNLEMNFMILLVGLVSREMLGSV